MKKLFFIGILSLFSGVLKAQELQLHYDFSEERRYLTATFEIYREDSYGTTFMFSDVNFGRSDGASLTYFEIARTFILPNRTIKDLNLHIEYNDGFLISDTDPLIAYPINRAFLIGFGFPVRIAGFSIKTSYLYKSIKNSSGIDGQFTAVWFQNFFQNTLTFRGFFDVWSETKWGNKKMVIITEPQLLYNFNSTFSLGTEVEISKNFVSKDWKVFPTIMIRWNL